MSAEWTPTTEQVRDGYASDPEYEYNNPDMAPMAERENKKAFDRWLAARDLEMAVRLVAAWTVGGVPLPAEEQDVLVDWLLGRASIKDKEWR